MNPTNSSFEGPTAFKTYVDEFVNNGKKYGRYLDTSRLKIQFGDLNSYGPTVIGLCQLYLNSNPVITIRPEWFNSVNQIQQMLVLFHELGHCVLYRDHRLDLDFDPRLGAIIPSSIMYPSIFSSLLYEYRKEDYLKELYTYKDKK